MKKIMTLSCVTAMVILLTITLFADITCKDAAKGFKRGEISHNDWVSICMNEKENIQFKKLNVLSNRIITLEKTNQELNLEIIKTIKLLDERPVPLFAKIAFGLFPCLLILAIFIISYEGKKSKKHS